MSWKLVTVVCMYRARFDGLGGLSTVTLLVEREVVSSRDGLLTVTSAVQRQVLWQTPWAPITPVPQVFE